MTMIWWLVGLIIWLGSGLVMRGMIKYWFIERFVEHGFLSKEEGWSNGDEIGSWIGVLLGIPFALRSYLFLLTDAESVGPRGGAFRKYGFMW